MLNLDIKRIYTTIDDNIGQDFYNKVLSKSSEYMRVSGYFSSAALSHFSRGIYSLYRSNGKYRLIISSQISEEDFEKIKNGYIERDEYNAYAEDKLSDYDSLSSNQKRDIANLAFLIKCGLIDIKIGFTKSGLFHSKYGIMTDGSHSVYFSGSLNETQAAFLNNYESIVTVKSWDTHDDLAMINNERRKFESLWLEDNNEEIVYVKSFNELVKNKLMKYNKGVFITEKYSVVDDAIILYYDKELKLVNNLKNHQLIESNRRINRIKKYLTGSQNWVFNSRLNYLQLKKIIREFNKYAERQNIKVHVDDTLEEFILNNEFLINKESEKALLIKSQSQELEYELNEFNKILIAEVERPLREIQQWVSFYLTSLKRAANYSVPGAGKTAMMYGAFAYLSSKRMNLVDKMVIVGPKSSFLSWKDEFKLVFGNKRELRVLDIHDRRFNETDLYKNVDQYNVILFNYESLEKYENQMNNIINSKTMLVFDEVHKIKKVSENELSRSNIAIRLSENAKYKYVLTGTPIPNTYQDIWTSLQILYGFEYNLYFQKGPEELRSMKDFDVTAFNEKLFPFYWRVTKKDLNVPIANPDNIKVFTISNREQDLVDLVWKKYRKNPLQLFIRLMQVTSNPALLLSAIKEDDYNFDDFSNDINDFENNVLSYTSDEIEFINNFKYTEKFVQTAELVKDLSSQCRISIVWCITKDTMKKLESYLINLGLNVVLIYGDIEQSSREDLINRFKNKEFDVLITNPHTLGESVSLHMVAHDAIYLEYSFNLVHMLQSRDRIHRLGLKENQETNYYYILAKEQEGRSKTIDQRVYDRLHEKEMIMIEAIEGTVIKPMYSVNKKEEILEFMREI